MAFQLLITLVALCAFGVSLFGYGRTRRLVDIGKEAANRSASFARAAEDAKESAKRLQVKVGGWVAWQIAYGQTVDAGLSYPAALHAGNDAALAFWRGELGTGVGSSYAGAGVTGDDVARWLAELCEEQARRVGGQVVVERGVELRVRYRDGRDVVLTDSRAMHHHAMSTTGPQWAVIWTTGRAVVDPVEVLVRPVEWVAGVDEPAAVGRAITPPDGVPVAPAAGGEGPPAPGVSAVPPVVPAAACESLASGPQEAQEAQEAPPAPAATDRGPAAALAHVVGREGSYELAAHIPVERGNGTGELVAVGSAFAGALARAFDQAPAVVAEALAEERQPVRYLTVGAPTDCDKCPGQLAPGERAVVVDYPAVDLSDGGGFGVDVVHRRCFLEMAPELMTRGRAYADATLALMTAEVDAGAYDPPLDVARAGTLERLGHELLAERGVVEPPPCEPCAAGDHDRCTSSAASPCGCSFPADCSLPNDTH